MSRSHLLKRFNMVFYHAAPPCQLRSPQAPLLPLHGNGLAEAAANALYQITVCGKESDFGGLLHSVGECESIVYHDAEDRRSWAYLARMQAFRLSDLGIALRFAIRCGSFYFLLTSPRRGSGRGGEAHSFSPLSLCSSLLRSFTS